MSENPTRTRYCSRCLTTFIGDLERCPNLGCRARRPATAWGTLLEAGDTFDRHYRIEKRLAIGGAGVTYLGREVDASSELVGPWLAIKVLYAQRDEGSFLRRLSNEAQILQELDHPNIVQLMGFVHRRGHSPYLLTRFEEGGSLLDHLRRVGALSLKEAAKIGIQLCDALYVAHERGVIHRDLKPENVLLSRVPRPGETPRVRITDFGIAKVYGGLGGNLTKVGAFVGTPQYAAPEQFEGREPTPATDIYALGAVLHFLVTLRPLVPTADQLSPEQTLQILQDALPPRLELPGVDPGELAAFNAFLASTMAPEATERGDIQRARELLDAVVYDQPPILSVQHTDESPEADATEVMHRPLQPAPPPGGGPMPGPDDDTFAGILSKAPAAPPAAAPPAAAPPAAVRALPPDNPGHLVDLAEVDASQPVLSPRDLLDEASPAAGAPEAAAGAPQAAASPPPAKKRSRLLLLGAAVIFLGLVGVGGIAGAVIYGIFSIPGFSPDPDGPADDGDGGSADGGAGGEPARAQLTLDPRKPLHQRDILAIEESLAAQTSALSGCELGGVSAVEMKLVIDPSGDILSAAVSDLDAAARRCVQDAISALTVKRAGPTSKMTAEVRLDVPTP